MSIIWEFARRPRLTGAVAASSARLARAMVDGLGLHHAATVVELGPGTGVFTDEILRQLGAGTRLVAIEANRTLAGRLRRRYRGKPVEVVWGPAAALPRWVDGPVDVIVSGLPWALMPAEDQHATLEAISGGLSEHGRFTTFAYAHAIWTPPAVRLAAALRERFTVLHRSPLVWANVPPAFVYRAALPVHPGGSRSQEVAARTAGQLAAR